MSEGARSGRHGNRSSHRSSRGVGMASYHAAEEHVAAFLDACFLMLRVPVVLNIEDVIYINRYVNE